MEGDLLTQAQLLAFNNFKKGLKLVETASCPLQKVLAKLRSGTAVSPMVLPVRAKKQVLEEEEEEVEEEVAPSTSKEEEGGKVGRGGRG